MVSFNVHIFYNNDKLLQNFPYLQHIHDEKWQTYVSEFERWLIVS